MSDLTCPVCHGAVPPKGATGPRATYCSINCRRAIAPRSPDHRIYVSVLSDRVCEECGATFVGRIDALTCSQRCGNKRRDHSPTNICTETDCDRGVRAKGLCNMHWRRIARAEGREANPVWDARRAANWKKRSALKKGAPNAEQIVYRDVFDRDGWSCGICSEPVDPATDWPDPLSASLDHILPLSKGGPHTMANVQLAHLDCNLRKGVTVAA